MSDNEWTERGKPIPYPDEPEVHHAWEWREIERRQGERRDVDQLKDDGPGARKYQWVDRRIAQRTVDLDHVSGPTSMLVELAGIAADLDGFADDDVLAIQGNPYIARTLHHHAERIRLALGTA